jgi:glycosyltransferase involved in cell wall biosynthesis
MNDNTPPDRPLVIAQLLPALQSGGVERGTLEVAAEVIRCGHRAIVISAGGQLLDELLAFGGEHINWPVGDKSLAALRWTLHLRQLFNNGHIDIVHARSRLPAWLTWLAWRKADVKLRPRFVTTVHGLYSVSRYSAIMTRSEAVIAVSQTVRGYILQHYPCDPERVHLIYRGVAAQDFPYGHQPAADWLEHWYRDYPQLRGQRLLTLAGRLSRRKGHEDFITLIGRLRQRGVAVHGVIVGALDQRRPYIDTLQRQITRANIAGHITFTGQRQDIRDIYAISDLVFSLSAKPESFGRTVLEALSLGRPVVGYDHGGVGEILTALFPAGKVAPGGLQELTDKTAALLQSCPPVPAEQPFSRQYMLDQTLALYTQLAGQRRELTAESQ